MLGVILQCESSCECCHRRAFSRGNSLSRVSQHTLMSTENPRGVALPGLKYRMRWKRKTLLSRVLEALTLQSPLARGCSSSFPWRCPLAGIPILSNGLYFKAGVKSAQKIPYSSVGFGLGTCRDEKNTFNFQCLVNISKSE